MAVPLCSKLPSLAGSPRRENVMNLLQLLLDEFELVCKQCDNVMKENATLDNLCTSPDMQMAVEEQVNLRKTSNGSTLPSIAVERPQFLDQGSPPSSRNPQPPSVSEFRPRDYLALATEPQEALASDPPLKESIASRVDAARGCGPRSKSAIWDEIDGCENTPAKDGSSALDEFANQLSQEYMERLRVQFDLLDTDEDDRITYDQCASLVEKFVGHQMDAAELEEVFGTLKNYNADNDKSDGMKSATTTDGKHITFEQFVSIMGPHKTSDDGEPTKFQKTMAMLKKAFEKASATEQRLAELAEERREKHDRLALLLDIIPGPVIILNAATMGLRADFEDTTSDTLWMSFDYFFLAFYSLEAFSKLHVFGWTVYWFGPEKFWNWFDILCIVFSLMDNVVTLFVPGMDDMNELMLLKMFRLLKMARLVKALRYPFFDELKLMIFGVMSGMRTLFWALVLLFGIVYFLAIIMNSIAKSDFVEFETVPQSMFTIFRCFTDGCAAYNGTPLQETLREEHGSIFVLAYILTIMLVTFGLFNLIMAIFIENVMDSGSKRRQKKLGGKSKYIRDRFSEMFAKLIMHCKTAGGKRHHLLTSKEKKALQVQWEMDCQAAFNALPPDLAISTEIFKGWIRDSDFIDLLDDADIDSSNAHELFDALDADMSGSLTPTEIVDGLLKMRGPITKADMIAIRMKMRYSISILQDIRGDSQRYHDEIIQTLRSFSDYRCYYKDEIH